MAGRPAGINPPALKIKLKPRLENHNNSSTPQQPVTLFQNKTNPAHQKSEEDEEEEEEEEDEEEGGRREDGNKRKCSSPVSSPVSKRSFREDSEGPVSEESEENFLAPSGLPEIFADKSEQLSSEPLLVKHRLRHYHASIVALIKREKQGKVEDESTRPKRRKIPSITLENISHGQLQVISVIPSRMGACSQDEATQNDSTTRPPIDATNTHPFASWSRPDLRPCKSHDIAIIPTHASWFTWDHIHKLERQAMPQLFYGKSKLQSVETFIHARNAIIKKYRLNPRIRVCLADIQGTANLSDKDLGHILDFLVQWGLVNYQVEANTEAAGFKYPTKVPVYLIEDAVGVLSASELSLNPLEYLYRYEPLQVPAMALKSLLANEESSAVVAENMVREASNGSIIGTSGNPCSVCSNDCSQHHFYCEKQGDYILCSDCYGDGNLGIGMTTTDFVLSNESSGEAVDLCDNGNWSDHETLLLLEALEVHGDNWAEVSEFVGTKSKAQCISQFIGLSIEDTFFEDMELPSSFTTVKTKQAEECSNTLIDLESRAPDGSDQINSEELQGEPEVNVAFEGANNPVMSLVAFLAATVGPRVAAVAAHAALSSLSEAYKASDLMANGLDHNAGMGSTALQTTESIAGNSIRKDVHQSRLSNDSLRKVTSSALAMAAMKAKLLADQEEREVQRLCAIIVDNQLKKLSLKLKQLGDIDVVLEKEREQMERNRQRHAAERIRFASSHLGPTTMVPPQQMLVPTIPGGKPPGPVVPPVTNVLPIPNMSSGPIHHQPQMVRPAMYKFGPGGMQMLDGP